MPDATQLTDLQIALLRVLWDRQEATVAEIRLPSCGYRRARTSYDVSVPNAHAIWKLLHHDAQTPSRLAPSNLTSTIHPVAPHAIPCSPPI